MPRVGRWAVGAVVALGLALELLSRARLQPLRVGAPAPVWSLPELGASARIHQLSQYRGRVLIVEAWNETCGNCRIAFPALRDLAAAHAAEGLRFLPVALDGSEAQQIRLLSEWHWSDMSLRDVDGEFRRQYLVPGVPFTVLIDRTGRVRGQWYGVPAGDLPHELVSPAGLELVQHVLADTGASPAR